MLCPHNKKCTDVLTDAHYTIRTVITFCRINVNSYTGLPLPLPLPHRLPLPLPLPLPDKCARSFIPIWVDFVSSEERNFLRVLLIFALFGWGRAHLTAKEWGFHFVSILCHLYPIRLCYSNYLFVYQYSFKLCLLLIFPTVISVFLVVFYATSWKFTINTCLQLKRPENTSLFISSIILVLP